MVGMLKGEALLAYIAGIIDGEGTIGIKKTNKRYSTIRVNVGNTNQWLIEFLQMQFGGYTWLNRPENNNWKECWRWEVVARKAYRVLILISPYLQIKRDQAELAIQFQQRRMKGKNILSSEDKIADEIDELAMKAWNKRGCEK